MNREFLDLYNTELRLLYEHAAEFAEEYPGVAERLGGLTADRTDPMLAGLLEGSAFLAARVQLKMKHEFSEFTNNLLDQLVPNFLAPTPSAIMVSVDPVFGDSNLRQGRTIKRGSYLDATYVARDRKIACRYRLSSDVELWPFEIKDAEYYGAPGALQALGLPPRVDIVAGLRIALTCRHAKTAEGETSDEEALKKPERWFAGCKATSLPFHILGTEAECVQIYEQIFGHAKAVYFRFLDGFGDPVIVEAPPDCIEQIGFAENEMLFDNDMRVFRGFDFLREFFVFPQKYFGFRITKLDQIMSQLKAKFVELIIGLDEANIRLQSVTSKKTFALYTVPAVNLFERTTDRIPVRSNQHEYHVLPDRARYLDYEPHNIRQVYAHYPGGTEKVPVYPLYSAPPQEVPTNEALFYTMRRLPRRQTTRERQFGTASDYTGTDMFISITEPDAGGNRPQVAELSVRAICSNRHLTEHLPVGQGGADFRFLEDTSLMVRCVGGPTPPREPILSYQRGRGETVHTGTVTWRLINLLALNHLGLVERGAGSDGASIRELLSLFADLADSSVERRIRGLRQIDSRSIIRRIRQRTGVGAARGIEITVTLDDRAFEGSGVFVLGALLDRFFAEYAAVNHFTQTVIKTTDRGEIMRWPPRIGSRQPL